MKKYNQYIIYLLLLLITVPAFAQKEANNWFFGAYGGLTWNNTRQFVATGTTGNYGTTVGATLDNMPVFVDGSQIATSEGCFSLSNSNGELLFYSNGTTIWNKNNDMMFNGDEMGGSGTSAQSGIILPYPGHPNQYIAVSIAQTSKSLMEYAVIDMTKEGGLGAVTSKNNKFTGNSGHTAETVTSIRHANKQDYWIVAPGRGSTLYLNAYPVTSSGVDSSSPVITNFNTFGITSSTSTTSSCGYIKFSPNGKHFVWATYSSNGNVYYGDFDSENGTFDNIKELPGTNYYGVEFSPSGDYLYLTVANGGYDSNTNSLHIYDFAQLQAASTPSTVSKKTLTFQGNTPQGGTGFGAVQLGPDMRIYLASGWIGADTNPKTKVCYVVDNPEEYDNLRIYQLDNFLPTSTIVGGTSRAPRFNMGLPSFAANWFNVSLDGEDSFCVNTPQTFTVTIETGAGPDEVSHTIWDFGDGSPTITDTTIGVQNQTYTYTKRGSYTITVKAYRQSDGTELTEQRQTLIVKVNSCHLPVNHNISVQ